MKGIDGVVGAPVSLQTSSVKIRTWEPLLERKLPVTQHPHFVLLFLKYFCLLGCARS